MPRIVCEPLSTWEHAALAFVIELALASNTPPAQSEAYRALLAKLRGAVSIELVSNALG
jgi:hypothetical protein